MDERLFRAVITYLLDEKFAHPHLCWSRLCGAALGGGLWMRGNLLLDAKRLLNPREMINLGFHYHGTGYGK